LYLIHALIHLALNPMSTWIRGRTGIVPMGAQQPDPEAFAFKSVASIKEAVGLIRAVHHDLDECILTGCSGEPHVRAIQRRDTGPPSIQMNISSCTVARNVCSKFPCAQAKHCNVRVSGITP
jgi:hypothetical protein